MTAKQLFINACLAEEKAQKEKWANHKELRLDMFLSALRKGYNQDVIQWYYDDEMHQDINADIILPDGTKINPLVIIIFKQTNPERDCKFFLERGFIDLAEPLIKAVNKGNRDIINMIIEADGAYNIDTMSVYRAISVAKSAPYDSDIVDSLNKKFRLPPSYTCYPSLMPFPYTTLEEVVEQYRKCFITDWGHIEMQWINIHKRIEQSQKLQEVIAYNIMKNRPPHYKDIIVIAKTLYISRYWKKKYVAMIALLILNYWRERYSIFYAKTEIDVEAHTILAELSS